MAHLPKYVQDLVTPFLLYHAQRHYDKTGHSFKTFNLEKEMAISGDLGDEDDVHGVDILNQYQYWFVSFDNFDGKFYGILEAAIAKFNKKHKKDNIKLHLSNVLANPSKHTICHSDSDHYGTYYFLIKVTDDNNKNFNYTLPAHIFEDLHEEVDTDKQSYETKEKLTCSESKIKHACPFGGELDIIKQDDGSYKTKSDISGDDQTIFLSDDYYRIWAEEYEYRYSLATLACKKKLAEEYQHSGITLDYDKNWYYEWHQIELKICEETIEKYKEKYTPWMIYDDPLDHLSDLAQLLIDTPVDSSNFELYLNKFIALKQSTF